MTPIESAVFVLNQAFALDPEAMHALVKNRVPCNEALGGHPTIQVGKVDDVRCVGLLGIVNGLFDIRPDGTGAIWAEFEEGQLVGFAVNDTVTVKAT